MLIPPRPKLSFFQRLHSSVQDVAERAGELTGQAATSAARHLEAFDKNYGVTNKVTAAGKHVGELVSKADAEYDIRTKVTGAYQAASEKANEITSTLKKNADKHGLTQAIENRIFIPAQKFSDAVGANENVLKLLQASENLYGDLRHLAKGVIAPNIPTYDCNELLKDTEGELNYIAACILQISPAESSRVGQQFGRAITAKISGLGGTGALLGIVATFGHAGTGAAISGLSGAAATSATMAWVGSLVGGGVAAGAALTGGLAFVIGLGAYKALASDRRDFKTLSDLEQRIVQSCWMLAAVAEAYRLRPHEFTGEAATDLFEKALVPLHNDIAEHLEVLCAPLDGKNALAMRQHVLTDFDSAVIQRFKFYLQWAFSEEGRAWNKSLAKEAATTSPAQLQTIESDAELKRILRNGNAEAAIGGVFAELLRGSPLDDTESSRLVLSALRRSSTGLHNASEQELGDHLRTLSPEGLKGEACNVKGIYHELYYVDRYNATHHDGSAARLHEPTNFPGSDVQIFDVKSGEVHQELQLKAVDTAEPIHVHMDRYPHISVAATDEAVASYHGQGHVELSGFSNRTLTQDTQENLDAMRHDTTTAHAVAAAEIALGIASTAELVQMLRGVRPFPAAVMNVGTKVAASVGATLVTAYLFS
jgi:hypothetical protein